MRKLLILARGENRSFFGVDGKPLLANLPYPIIVFTDAAHRPLFDGLGPHVEVVVVKWSDPAAWMQRARALHAGEPLCGIATTSEMMMDAAGELREAFGLPGMGGEMTARFRDKRLMKKRLGAAGLRVPRHANCDDRDAVGDILARHGRIVIKPFDGLGSKAVAFINTFAELDLWYRDCPDVSNYQAEEFIDGILYHVNAVVVDHVARLTLSAPYLPGMANIDFSSGAPFVSKIMTPSGLRYRLQNFSDKAIAALGMEYGVTHLECFHTENDELVFCEVAARPGGGGIVWMMEAYSGVNYAEAVLHLEAGRADLLTFPDSEPKDSITGMMGFRWPRNGFVRALPEAACFKEPWVHRYDPEYNTGDFVAACAHCTDYLGLLIFSSPDTDEFTARQSVLYDRFYSALKMEAV